LATASELVEELVMDLALLSELELGSAVVV
jgi:hypothetical protein